MRLLTLLTAALVLSASAIAAPAPAATPAAASAAVAAVQVSGSNYKLRPAEFDGVIGSYNLDNGSTLRVSAEHRRLYAEVDGAARAELQAVAANTFVANGKRVVFDQIPFATSVSIADAAR